MLHERIIVMHILLHRRRFVKLMPLRESGAKGIWRIAYYAVLGRGTEWGVGTVSRHRRACFRKDSRPLILKLFSCPLILKIL